MKKLVLTGCLLAALAMPLYGSTKVDTNTQDFKAGVFCGYNIGLKEAKLIMAGKERKYNPDRILKEAKELWLNIDKKEGKQ